MQSFRESEEVACISRSWKRAGAWGVVAFRNEAGIAPVATADGNAPRTHHQEALKDLNAAST